MHQLYLASFFTALRLAWQAALKKAKVKLNLLTDINMVLIVEKDFELGYAMLFINILKTMRNT